MNYYVYVYCGLNKHSLWMNDKGKVVIINNENRVRVLHRDLLHVVHFAVTNCFPDKVEVIPAD